MLRASEPAWTETLRQQVGGVGAGVHICMLYDTPEQRIGALVPYFRTGLARGEQCLYIADDASVDDLRANGMGNDEDLARR